MATDARDVWATPRAAVGRGLRAAEARPRGARAVCGAVLALLGAALAVPNAGPLLRPGPTVGVALSLAGTLVSVGLLAVGYLFVARGVEAESAVRITAWTLLGTAVLGTVVGLLFVYQADTGGSVVDPDFVAANVVAVGAGAHVIVGVYDTQRVRADRLERERRRVAVLNRVLRHNLRNEATVLRLHAELLREELGETDHRSVEAITDASETLAGLADETREITAALEREGKRLGTADVAALVREAVADAREDADATIALDAPEELPVRGDTGVRTAIEQLLDNALEHGGERVSVTVGAAEGWVTVRVADDGPGIPATERRVVTGESEITQLTHGSGLGLWVAKTVAECYRGELVFEDPESGTAVLLRLPAA
jgi:signal transduction histidine kinase